jgi:hypothetical protein
MAHIRRADWIVTLWSRLVHCVNWFNPLVWHACRRLRFESECACDDLVLASGVSGPDYAAHLVDVARAAATHHPAWSPAIAIAHPSTLEGRIRAMLNTRANRTPLTGRARSAILAAALITAVPISAATLSSLPAPPVPAAPARAVEALPLITASPVDVAIAATQEPGVVQGPRPAGGAIEGVLYDQFGGRLPGVSLSLSSDGLRFQTFSGRDGSFAFRDLPGADYELSTSLPGFTNVRNLIRTEPGATVRRLITLPIGTVQETISVVCEVASLSAGRPSAPTSSAAPGMPARPVRAVSPSGRPRIEPGSTSFQAGSIGGQIKAPNKTSHTNPVCPSGVAPTGTVVRLAARIGIDGLLTDISDVSPAPQPAYTASALEAVRMWTFTPVLLNGVPIEAGITMTIDYSWK